MSATSSAEHVLRDQRPESGAPSSQQEASKQACQLRPAMDMGAVICDSVARTTPDCCGGLHRSVRLRRLAELQQYAVAVMVHPTGVASVLVNAHMVCKMNWRPQDCVSRVRCVRAKCTGVLDQALNLPAGSHHPATPDCRLAKMCPAR